MWRCGTRRPGLPPRRGPGLSATFRTSILFYLLPGWLRIYKVPAGSGAATRAPCHPHCTHAPEGSGREGIPARDTCELGAVPGGPLAEMSHSPCPCHLAVPGIQALRQISKAGSAPPPPGAPQPCISTGVSGRGQARLHGQRWQVPRSLPARLAPGHPSACAVTPF